MRRYNIAVPKKYTKDGVEKTAWSNVGKLVRFDATSEKPESFILELGMFPDTRFAVFEEKPREDTPKIEEPVKSIPVDPQDIPF